MHSPTHSCESWYLCSVGHHCPGHVRTEHLLPYRERWAVLRASGLPAVLSLRIHVLAGPRFFGDSAIRVEVRAAQVERKGAVMMQDLSSNPRSPADAGFALC